MRWTKRTTSRSEIRLAGQGTLVNVALSATAAPTKRRIKHPCRGGVTATVVFGPWEVSMRPDDRTDNLSRRGALTGVLGCLVGLAGVGALASDAAAQTAGMVRRQERRAVRHDRRDDRREHRQDRRDARRTPAATGIPTTTGTIAPAPAPQP